MTWSNAYIDIPFLYDGRDRNGLDCWGIVFVVYRDQLGITLPDYRGMFTDGSLPTILRRAKLMDAEREKWERRSPHEDPKPYDIVLLRTKGVPSHVGIVIDSRRMLHITEGINSCVEDFTGAMWKDRVLGFYWRAYD